MSGPLVLWQKYILVYKYYACCVRVLAQYFLIPWASNVPYSCTNVM